MDFSDKTIKETKKRLFMVILGGGVVLLFAYGLSLVFKCIA